jgi:hypothetical protein
MSENIGFALYSSRKLGKHDNKPGLILGCSQKDKAIPFKGNKNCWVNMVVFCYQHGLLQTKKIAIPTSLRIQDIP